MTKALLFLILLSTCAFVIAQDDQAAVSCPTISVSGPQGTGKSGDIIYYTVDLGAAAKNYSLTFVWSVSTGKIVSGQGTTQIGAVRESTQQTVTVEVKGLPAKCRNMASETGSWDPPPRPEKLSQISLPLDSAGGETFQKVADAARKNPNSQLYIFIPPDVRIQNEVADRLDRAIPEYRGDRQRIIFINTSPRSAAIQIWLVPPGATPPSKCDGCEPSAIAPAAATATNCPILEVSGPGGVTPPGNIMPFVLIVSDPKLKKLSFAWTVSAGTIVEGQGMRVVKVKAPSQSKPINLTATVRITGLSQGCTDTASVSSPVAPVSK